MYAAPAGVTRQQANKQRLAEIEQMSASLREVVELLRQGSEADAIIALRRIRQAEQIDEAVNVLAVAQALVPPTSTIQATSSFSSQLDERLSIYQHRQLVDRSRSTSYAPTPSQAT